MCRGAVPVRPRNRLMALTNGGVTTCFQYDNAGNLLTDDKARYSYDVFNRTTKVETFDGNVQINRYDFTLDREAVTEEDSTGLTRLPRCTCLYVKR